MSQLESGTEVAIGNMRFKNPILLASGPLSSNEETLLKAVKAGFGGVISKTVTFEPCEGNPMPRWAFRDFYLVASDGLPNPGYKKMTEIFYRVKESEPDVPLIASIAGTSPEEYTEIAVSFEKAGADAIELNLVCPHRGRLVGRPGDEPLGEFWSRSSERARSVIGMVKKQLHVPLWAKFPYERPMAVVRAIEEAGADALVPFPGIPGMVIDPEKGRPVLGNIEGSGTIIGQAIKPLGIKVVSELCRKVEVPVIGTGGVAKSDDILEYILAGASAVQVLTQVMMKKFDMKEILSGIDEFMGRKGIKNIYEIRGQALKCLPPRQ